MSHRPKPRPGRIILLHGASSSGKSTLARVLQSTLDEPFWHISIDHLRDSGVLPSARIAQGDFRWSEMRASFFDGFHRSLAAYASAGNNLIVEHILDTAGWLDDLVTLLAPFEVFFVGLHCPLPELVRREQARGDRRIGSAEQDHKTIHRGQRYDLELQSDQDVAENVARLITAWRARSSASIFSSLAARQPDPGPS
ncbi:MAG TPA: AAA family ATPase [Bosea sp. (in: a-proteobacteria)]|jgi:chloramphenicol 3-O phosphotransferase|uniref:chloramphenicol phosphotransferase CPT family protein n=1 Tax=Bosea sp. (in: a-proteobacteria) TaxID=1871050 RepID=UPI002E1154CA|nr:AAA family ATPase [Bosea sp. (in: a-proteobacteria)]